MRWKCTCEYDGTEFSGWQSQPNGNAIQDHIEACLGRIFNHRICICGSGRTDAGAHARGQVFHFDGEWKHEPNKLLQAFLCRLPCSIRIIDIEHVDPSFHARFSIKKKCYKYQLIENFPGAFNYKYNWCLENKRLNLGKMQAMAQHFHGKHNFSAFGANRADRSIQNPIKIVHEIKFEKLGELIIFTIVGNGFLYKMVRMLVGSFVMLGSDKIDSETMLNMLLCGERKSNVEVAPAHGLFLHSVEY